MVTEERTVEGAGAEVLELPLEMGALRRVPLWHPHARARNWLARIALDPREPGGLKRAFAPRANGEYYYLVGGLHVGDPIEFGADYYTGSGRRSSGRWSSRARRRNRRSTRTWRACAMTRWSPSSVDAGTW